MEINEKKYRKLVEDFDILLLQLSQPLSPIIHVNNLRKILPRKVKQLKALRNGTIRNN